LLRREVGLRRRRFNGSEVPNLRPSPERAHLLGMADRFVHPELKDVSLTAVLRALADPGRRAIVRALAAKDGGCLACHEAAPACLPKATRSNHFAALRAAGLLYAERRGVEVRHVLRREEVEARFPGLLAAILAADAADAADAGESGPAARPVSRSR
jgi:DNA-binding transcriptional ArsR family regulator